MRLTISVRKKIKPQQQKMLNASYILFRKHFKIKSFRISTHVYRYTYETLLNIANFLLDRTAIRPKIAIICGSGLGSLADQLTECDAFPYEDIPDFPVSTVEGHAGKMIFGHLGSVPVMCMQGRFHYYEGYPLAKVSFALGFFSSRIPKHINWKLFLLSSVRCQSV